MFEKVYDYLLTLTPEMKLSLAGVLVDSAAVDLNQSVEEVFELLMKVSKEVNKDMGPFRYDE